MRDTYSAEVRTDRGSRAGHGRVNPKSRWRKRFKFGQYCEVPGAEVA